MTDKKYTLGIDIGEYLYPGLQILRIEVGLLPR